jgi:hypothetical protein
MLGISVLPLNFALLVSLGSFSHLQNKEELVNFRNATSTSVLSSVDELIGRIFYENQTNISNTQIP